MGCLLQILLWPFKLIGCLFYFLGFKHNDY